MPVAINDTTSETAKPNMSSDEVETDRISVSVQRQMDLIKQASGDNTSRAREDQRKNTDALTFNGSSSPSESQRGSHTNMFFQAA